MRKARKKQGFTLAEVMIVVGIILVLATVSFVLVSRYLRSVTKSQYDDYARELFIAAQNHLSAAETETYLKRTDYGTEDPDEEGVYYYAVTSANRNTVNGEDSLLSLMLPFGALDETVRGGGDYIIRYHKDSGQILDVFYWSESGRYDFTGYTDDDYAAFLAARDNRDALASYGAKNAVIGYYGSTDATGLTRGAPLEPPTVLVENAERLRVIVTDNNTAETMAEKGYTLKLTVKGVSSGATWSVIATADNIGAITGDGPRLSGDPASFVLILDDVTDPANMHFNTFALGSGFIPGEDLEVQAVAMNTAQLTNVAYSAAQTANSLFGPGTTAGSAKIANIRHLENLSQKISGVTGVTSAEQTTDLNWPAFTAAIGGSGVRVYPTDGSTGNPGPYMPVDAPSGLVYDGGGHGISEIEVTGTGRAGVFATLENGSVQDLKLTDFTLTGSDVGALAGYADGTTVSNVLALSSSSGVSLAGGNVGGLIGEAKNATILNSAAALVLRSTDLFNGVAGGLVGKMDGDRSSVSGCYSGGHTTNGAYDPTAYNVYGRTAGGLIGDADGATIVYSYSTCSVSGDTAGGLVGSASGSISSCYATGLVNPSSGTKGAFAGTLTGTATGCSYYEIVNKLQDATNTKIFTYLGPVGTGTATGITPMDETAATLNEFSGKKTDTDPDSLEAWQKASPYDGKLSAYYDGKYPLKTVAQLRETTGSGFVATHYGDWPAPELMVING